MAAMCGGTTDARPPTDEERTKIENVCEAENKIFNKLIAFFLNFGYFR